MPSDLGSIALQSLRVADTRLGDRVVVIGLGLVGLMAVQLLRAAGCRVFGIDIDPARVAFVKAQGYGDAERNDAANLRERVAAFCGGEGADAVIITAATDDNGPVALAGELARRKGRVVAVGRTRLKAPRETYLFKELELCTSMAYGPGTGDPAYELDGNDYPYAYVRWSEGRNMAAVLDQIASGALQLEALITHEFPIDEAGKAFELITGKTGEPTTAVLLKYPRSGSAPDAGERIPLAGKAAVPVSGGIRIGVIGAGSFATNEFLPLLAKQDDIVLQSISSATGVRARALGEQYGFAACSSETRSLIEADDIDALFILTRHDTHARLAAAALRAGKHVFVEKPLALSREELEEVRAAQQDSGCQLMVGFNRRYAPLAIEMKSFFGQRAQPLSISYCANVGYRPPEHWLHDPLQGGGVVLGEACHHIDFCNWFVGQAPVTVSARKLEGGAGDFIPDDNVHITLSYADGSLAHVAYLSNGSKAWDAERAEVFCDNKVAGLRDFRRLDLARGMSRRRKRLWIGSDKGHAGQIAAFLSAVSGRGEGIDVASYLDSSAAAISAAEALRA